jgi:hypothetical protein
VVTFWRFAQLLHNAKLNSLGEDKTFFVKTKRQLTENAAIA